ncbi:MAG: cbb3-type cytochrome c oxidase subunit II [Planctomycetota bacterium]|nr:cbb3-type cytochrome c oxidase subunit II [Planctomycetota bacterium]
MKMTPVLLIVAALLIFWVSTFLAVLLPAVTVSDRPSPARQGVQWSADVAAGHDLYNRNGCSYCHSQFVRAIDWEGQRLAQSGDYAGMEPIILGTERTGPDLSQEGGLHPDDWHAAHFVNPRHTRPLSIMPSWEFLGDTAVRQLTAYMQSEGGRDADAHVQDQRDYHAQALGAYRAGPDRNVRWLHDNVPAVWRDMPNPYPATESARERGKAVYLQFCVNCHGLVGDGQGSAAKFLDPPPLNFTTLRRNLAQGKYIGGIFYYQIMNGVTGTAMPYFKRELESEKIWAVSNYLAVQFLGYTDATLEPRGIPAAGEPAWKNSYTAPTTGPAREGAP